MTLTSTTVSSGPSLITRTSTFRRLSPSSIKAASTASSRVRPRPSADLIAPPPLPHLFSHHFPHFLRLLDPAPGCGDGLSPGLDPFFGPPPPLGATASTGPPPSRLGRRLPHPTTKY